MAVEHVDTIPGSIMGLDFDYLVGSEPDDVLETQRLVGIEGSTIIGIGAGEDLEVNQVDVDGVTPAATAVLELPDLDGATGNVSKYAVVDLGEADSVNLPHSVGAVELEVTINAALRGREVNHGKGAGDGAGVGHRAAADDKLHDLVGVEVVGISPHIFSVPEGDVLASKGRKVEDDLVSLSHTDVKLRSSGGHSEESSIGRNDLEGYLSTRTRSAAEVEQKGPGDGSVEEPEAILPRLDVEVGPGLAVDMNDIAEERVGLGGGAEKRAIVQVLLGREDERNVVNPISRGQIQRVLFLVMDDVCASLAKVGIFSRLWLIWSIPINGPRLYTSTAEGIITYMVNGMVVVPLETSRLAVWIVVILKLSGLGHILSPTVPRGTL